MPDINDERIISSMQNLADGDAENTLRPKYMRDYIGQEKVKKNLGVCIEAAKLRGEPLDHVLLYGPPGLGKTTLSHIIANEMGAHIWITSGPAIEKAGDLASIISNLNENDVLFIDEIHRLNRSVEEILYPAMEEYVLDIIVGKGPGARSIRVPLPRFTLIGATTRAGMLTSPLRDRFGIIFRLEMYTPEELKRITKRSAALLNISIDESAADEISGRSRGTPRIANRLLKRVRDFADVEGTKVISERLASKALYAMGVDALGLDATDRNILETMIEKFNGGPVGLETIAAASGEESNTVEDVYEPYLMQLGFITRTPRGRVCLKTAYKHLGKPVPQDKDERQFDFFNEPNKE
ncbi:MAG: Holliday junction branch migration DNA helicase RuvB [Clostridiales bacterium]|jgi:Holliday junction DNA helicase RuvB|nr:Holliday junction branch migration DNA helicase RuvB [Clostridiales bacterium]